MTVFQAIVLGIVQGLGEFLPISSSAHLVLVPWLFRWTDPGLTFDVALHLGTLLSVIAFFWRDWLELISHGLRGISTPQGKFFWFIVAASIPGALAGAALEDQAETVFRNPLLIGSALIIMGLFLYAADRIGKKQTNLNQISLGTSLTIGISQALAIIPGVSRSGITMATGLFCGLDREATARFSFLLSTPIIVGAGVIKIPYLVQTPGALNTPFVAGVLTSAIVGFLAIGVLLRWLRSGSFAPFIIYRLLLGLLVIVVAFLRA